MFFEKAVPREARDTYRRDAWYGILAGIFAGSVFPFVGYIARDRLHASVGIISLMSAAPFIGSMLTLLYAKYIHGKRAMPYFVWPVALSRALFLLVVFASTPLSFALIVGASQLLIGLVGPAYATIMKEVYPEDKRGMIMAYMRIGLTFMLFASTLLVGELLNGVRIPFLDLKISPVDYKYIFPFGAVIGILSAVVFGTIKTKPIDKNHPDNQSIPTMQFLHDTLTILKEDRGFMWFALAIFVSGFGNLMVMPLYPIFQVDRLHISASQVAILSNTTTIVWMLSYPYWGRYVDVKSPLRATLISVLLASFIPLNYFFISYAFAASWWMILPASIISGATVGGTELAYFNSILYFAKDGKESQYQALHSFLLGVRGTIAPFCGAALVSLYKAFGQDMRYVFLIAMSMFLLGAAIQIVGAKKRS